MSSVSCPNCGHPNAETAKFCAKCGNKLSPGETLVMGSADLYDRPTPVPTPRPVAPPVAVQRPAPPTFTGAGTPPPVMATPPVAPMPPAKEQATYNPLQPVPPPAPSGYSPPGYGAPVAGAGGAAAAPAPSGGGHSYVAMRTIAGLCNVLAWVSLVVGVLGGLAGAFVGAGGFDVPMLLLGLLGGLIVGALGWVYWRLLGEGIWLALEIAANTRRTAAALEAQRRPL